MSSATINCVNDTDTNVIFGFCSAPNNHNNSVKVQANSSREITIDHDDARIAACWTGSLQLYPNNDLGSGSQFVWGGYIQPSKSYKATLSNKGLTVAQTT